MDRQQQKSSTASQNRPQYGLAQDASTKDTKEQKPSLQSSPPIGGQFSPGQHQFKSPVEPSKEPLKFNFTSVDSYGESFKADSHKPEYVRTDPDRPSTDNLLK